MVRSIRVSLFRFAVVHLCSGDESDGVGHDVAHEVVRSIGGRDLVLDPGEYCIGRRGESCEFQVRKWNERSRHTFLFRADAEEEDGITDKLSQ